MYSLYTTTTTTCVYIKHRMLDQQINTNVLNAFNKPYPVFKILFMC